MRITKIDAKNELYTDKKIRVAAYARVSTSEEDQLISLEAQKVYYEEYIKSNSEWLFVGLYSIEKHLIKNKIKTKRGGKWSSTTIKGILSNEKYTGDSLFQKTYTDENYKRNKNNGELQKYLVRIAMNL